MKKLQKLGEGEFVYEGETTTNEQSKTVYHGAGYLFNIETKCFFKGTWANGEKVKKEYFNKYLLKICGLESFRNGDIFEGSFLGGKFNGKGLLYNNVHGKYKYEGMFVKGSKEGAGREDYTSGSYYEGMFKQGQKHGEGKLQFTDGSYYMGDFQKGLPNGFGLHVALTSNRIVAVFPIPDKSDQIEQEQSINSESQYSEASNIEDDDDDDTKNNEFYYEGEFVDGYKHGIGRLHEPSGSYFYAYWEYNKPVRKIIYYEADTHNWKIIEIQDMVDNTDINFYKILSKIDLKIFPVKGQGYPDYNMDGYKSLIDEKGLKREHLEDPDFDFTEYPIFITDETGNLQLAPVINKRIFELECFKAHNYKLFQKEITPGCLDLNQLISCQQITCILDALTYHSNLFQRVFSRKYDTQIGFYTVQLYLENSWKEIIIDDLIPVNKVSLLPIFSNTKDPELGWCLIFKALGKLNQNFTYFKSDQSQTACKYLTMFTGMPCRTLCIPSYIKEPDTSENEDDKRINRLWRVLTEKHQRTSVRICYLEKKSSQNLDVPQNYAYHFIDGIKVFPRKHNQEDRYILMKSLIGSKSIKTTANDTYQYSQLDKNQQSAMNKLKEKNPYKPDDTRYFLIGYQEFLEYFDKVYMLMATRLTIQNHQQLIPREEEKYNNDVRIYTKFIVNVPSSMLFTVTQSHLSKSIGEESIECDKTLPIRLVLAKEKDRFTNKQQLKSSVANTISQVGSKKEDKKFNKTSKIQNPQDNQDKIVNQKPFKYVFGRGQKNQKQISKEVTLETGIYILLIQVEASDGKELYYPFEKLRFNLQIFSQSLIQIQRIMQINGFQRIVYETAILNAERYQMTEGKEPKYFSKVDLSERENGSSDLIIMQYFLKNEGTYLQYLRNKSTNKIWRQKLYFKIENMIILEQNDLTKVDLQLNTSDKRTHLVIIQQIGALQYNLEGGEGICIIDIQNEKREDFLPDEDGSQFDDDDEEKEKSAIRKKGKPAFDFNKQLAKSP